MKTWIINGLVYAGGTPKRWDVLLENGRIAGLEEQGAGEREGRVYDAAGKLVVPGFIDLHTHGGAGVDVNGASPEGFAKIAHFFATRGTCNWLCSILTDTKEQTELSIESALSYMKHQTNGANLMGIHLEGPFLAAAYKGAMPEHLLREMDVPLIREYQEKAQGNIRYLTASPEVSGVAEHVQDLTALGMIVAIGHSGADYETAWTAIRHGATAATHTFNAMKLLHQHYPAIMGAVIESDVYCEAICDGRHLHPGTVRFLLKAKGRERVVAVTDSIMAAGLPDGEYRLGVNEVIVENGDAKLKHGGTRAGSTLTTDMALKNLKAFTNWPLEDVLPLLTINPARLMRMEDRLGSIEIGKDADIVILSPELDVLDTFVKGQQIER